MTVKTFTFSNSILNPSDSQRLVITFSGEGIEISTGGCQLAQFSNAGLGSQMVNDIALDLNSPLTIYAGTNGVARTCSFDGGQTWNQINEVPLGALVVYSIVVD